jgi:hypothetical protein
MGGKVCNVDVEWGRGFEGLVAWARENEVDLLVPGPEQPLVDGVEGVFRRGELSAGAMLLHCLSSLVSLIRPSLPSCTPFYLPSSQPASPYSVLPPKPPV